MTQEEVLAAIAGECNLRGADLTAWRTACDAEEREAARIDSGEADDGGAAFIAAQRATVEARRALNCERGAPEDAALADDCGGSARWYVGESSIVTL